MDINKEMNIYKVNMVVRNQGSFFQCNIFLHYIVKKLLITIKYFSVNISKVGKYSLN